MSGDMPPPTEIPSWLGQGLVAWLVVGAGSGAVHEGIRMQLAGGGAGALVVMIAESSKVSRYVCDPPMHPCIHLLLGHKAHAFTGLIVVTGCHQVFALSAVWAWIGTHCRVFGW